MNDASSYYYRSLDRERQRAYHAILTGLLELAPSFSVPRLGNQELSDLYFMVRLDHPEIFYTDTFRLRWYEHADSVEMIPSYTLSRGKIHEHRQALQARIRKLCRQAEGLDEKGKEQFIHDTLCRSVRYDKLKKAYSHEIIGALGQGVAVCEGIAKAVKALCDALGLWCIIALSENNPEKGIKYRHTWNVVKIGKAFYHLDVTFDGSLSRGSVKRPAPEQPGRDREEAGAELVPVVDQNGEVTSLLGDLSQFRKKKNAAAASPQSLEPLRYDYFNLDDKSFFRDHEKLIWPVPVCTDGSRSYYREHGQSLTKYDDVRKKAAQAVGKDLPFIFHWRGGYLTREVLKDLLEILREEASKKGRHAAVSLNWPQAVLSVSFAPSAPRDEVLMEEANEGEQYSGEDPDE